MCAYDIRERSSGEEEQPGHELIDDRYRQLQEEIRLKEESVASMIVKMDALMAQSRIEAGGEPTPAASHHQTLSLCRLIT